jgi:polysaccharide chain length determinant protein (PEP-CTERM system associated)
VTRNHRHPDEADPADEILDGHAFAVSLADNGFSLSVTISNCVTSTDNEDYMVRNGQLTMSDVKRVFRRFWWILPALAVGLAVLGGAVAKILPKRYTSETRVLVARPTVSAKNVEPIVTEDLNHRLASMQEQILSRSRLEPVIEKFGLYATDRNRVHMEDLVARLRNSIVITPMDPIRGTEDRSLPGFTVSVSFNDPVMAQRICTEITSMFYKQNGEAGSNQANLVTTFFAGETENAKRNLDEQNTKLAEFKTAHWGTLPEEEQTNLSLLSGMNSQLEAANQALSRAQQDKAFNETLLAQAEDTWKSKMSGGPSPDSLDQQLQALQDQLSVLESRYTEEHPDVMKTKTQIADTKKKMEQAKTSGNGDAQVQRKVIEPANIQQLRAKKHQDEINIADLSKRQSQMQDQIRVLEGRVQASPVVEQQLKNLTMSYQAALDFYNDLQKKSNNSEMAKDLESQQQGERFQVLDAPNLPSSPSFPKPAFFAGGGAGLGIVFGLSLLYLVGVGDKGIYNEQDVEFCLKAPVLTMIPSIDSAARLVTVQIRTDKPRELAGTRA